MRQRGRGGPRWRGRCPALARWASLAPLQRLVTPSRGPAPPTGTPGARAGRGTRGVVGAAGVRGGSAGQGNERARGGIRLSLSLKDPGPGLPPFGLQGGLSWNRSARGDPVTQQPWLCVTRGKFLPEPVSLSVSPCGPSWRTWDRQPHCSATAREGKGADGLSKDLSSGSKVRETWVCGFGQSYYISEASISPLAKRVSDSATSGV